MTQKIALITGASRGLGAALAEELSPEFHIVAIARTTGALEELDDRIRAKGGEATLVPVDLTKPDAVAGICRAIFDRWGKIDLLAHAAIHAAPLAPAPHSAMKDLEKSIATNLTATQTVISMVAPLLGQDGTALFLDDPRAGEAFFGHYGSTKSAQISLARSWQAECKNTGPKIRIETPAPMPTATRARFFPGEDKSPLTSTRDEARRIVGLL